MTQGQGVDFCPHCGAVMVKPTEEFPFGLTRTENRIYNYIAKHPGCTMNDIYEAIYGSSAYRLETNTVSVHISRIKRKLRGLHLEASNRGPGATYRLIKDPTE